MAQSDERRHVELLEAEGFSPHNELMLSIVHDLFRLIPQLLVLYSRNLTPMDMRSGQLYHSQWRPYICDRFTDGVTVWYEAWPAPPDAHVYETRTLPIQWQLLAHMYRYVR